MTIEELLDTLKEICDDHKICGEEDMCTLYDEIMGMVNLFEEERNENL